MAKPLLVQTDRSPARKMPLSESDGGQPIPVTTSAQIDIHVVPQGYQDEVHIWAINSSAATDGAVLIRFGTAAADEFVLENANRVMLKVIDGLVLRGESGPVNIEALAITQAVLILGYVVRTAIEP